MSPRQCSCTQDFGLQWLLCVTVALNWLMHPQYSPDFNTPSDYFLFPNMKKNTWLEAVLDWWWGHIDSWGLFQGYRRRASYTTGIQALQNRWKKCVDRRGDECWKINHIYGQIQPLHHSWPINFSAHPRMRLVLFKSVTVYKIKADFQNGIWSLGKKCVPLE